MSSISPKTRRLVIQRAENRCEYCGLSQAGQEATFHIDHIHPDSAGGESSENNLALACVSCSLRKAARVDVIDPDTGEVAAVFNPRQQRWIDHFRWIGVRVLGITPVGRATVDALTMNRLLVLAIRAEEEHRGRHPPG